MMERQDLSCTYLPHHELESVVIIISIKSSQSLWREAARRGENSSNKLVNGTIPTNNLVIF